MTKLVSILLFSAATIGAPASAAPAAQPIAFQRNGIHYVGTVKARADGSSLIAGHEVESGRAFELRIAGGTVEGVYDHHYFSYDVPRATMAKRDKTGVAIAGNTGM